ncbi:unnamed protein product, partial [Rotaria magnacalcarata]
ADDRVKFEMQKVARFQTRQTNGSSSKRPRDSSSFETDLTIDKPQWRSKSTPPAASAPTKKSKR